MKLDRDVVEDQFKTELKILFPTEYPISLPSVEDSRSKFHGRRGWHELRLNEETDTQFEENFYDLTEGQKLYYLPALLAKAFDSEEQRQYRLDLLLGRPVPSLLPSLTSAQLRWVSRQAVYFGGRPRSEGIYSSVMDIFSLNDEI